MKAFLVLITLFYSAVLFGQTTNVLLERSYWKEKPSIEQVKAAIAEGNDPAAFNDHKFDAVTWAILEDASDAIVWFLLEQKGNDVNKRSHDGRTPIFWAAYRDNLNLMNALVEKGAKTDLIDSHGYSLANFAATTGQMNTAIYDLCIAHGAVLKDERNNDGATALLLILPHLKSLEMINYFTEKGLDLKDVDSEGNNAFAYAAMSGNELIMNYLLDLGIDPTANNNSAVFFASKGMRRKPNGVKTFEYLQKQGVKMDAIDKEGRNALHIVAGNAADVEVFDFFLEQGLSLNEPDANGNTPFFRAFESNSAETITYLLTKNRVEKVTQNANGENVLHIATNRGNAAILLLALEVDKRINDLSEVGLTPLHMAAMKSNDFELIEILLKAGADKKVKTPFEETAFDLAIENEWLTDKKRVKELLK